ncbi:class I SAM-dependent methyltransferase [uncultured Rubinisphaera sp.]|uniref:class I SAM-dependent methyltransferase n=1 Tax=uncultured Rubinisphaera sp. TaxID=1678686 RepID=UPI0030DCAF3B
MPQLTDLAHEAVSKVVHKGDVVIDATVGNGHDTTFLSELVGTEGRVLAFDIQSVAIEQAEQRLRNSGHQNVTWLAMDHARLAEVLQEEGISNVRSVMFNLGYLPGGDHEIVTHVDSTLNAIHSGLQALTVNGVMTILAYIGHSGGLEEAEAIEAFLNELDSATFETQFNHGNSPKSPRLLIVKRTADERR